jgi:hypothetical protein
MHRKETAEVDKVYTAGAPMDEERGGNSNLKKHLGRAVVEVACILFLFYSNLLMGEFERSGLGRKNGLAWAIGDILTAANFEIAMVAATVGYLFFEFLRRKF